MNTPKDLKYVTDMFEYISSKEGINNVFYIYLDSAYNVITESSLDYWLGLHFDSTNIPYLPDKPAKEQIKSFLNIKINKEKYTDVIPLNHEFRSHTILQTLQPEGREDNIRVAFQYFNNNKLLIVGISLQGNEDFQIIVRRIFLISYLLLLCVVIVGINLLTRKTLSGVDKVRKTAIRIGKNKFSFRVPTENETTEIKSLARAFNNMLDRIERLMKEQKEMTHNIAHDLRSPITSIRGIAETTLSANSSVKEYEQMTGKIIDNCDRLVHLINSMLDISDIESGNFAIKTQDVELQNIIYECFEIYQPIADEKEVQLIKNDNNIPVVINGNKHLMQRALGNIVGNAIKYTNSKGSVVVDTKTQNHEVFITISDNGIGIPKNEQERIFERFYRIEKSRSVEGNGLGLSLAKAYIEYQKGRIEVKSENGKGSAFVIVLPLA